MLVSPSVIAVLASAFFPTIQAWGSSGHKMTGRIAQHFLSDKAKAQLEVVLSESNGDLSDVSTWADQIKRSAGYAGWSAPLHYVDPKSEKPPSSCVYNDDEDCDGGNCVVGAITNYTERATCGPHYSSSERTIATKFLTHFIGDIAQPLHVCGRQRGGNQARAMYRSKQSNLHSIWDSDLLETRLREDFHGNMEDYVDDLVDKIHNGEYKSVASSWLSSYGFSDKANSGRLEAVIEWARDTNGFDCSTVWPDYDANPEQDLIDSYYEKVIPVVDIQLAKAGYRMADWFNKLFAEDCPFNTKGSTEGDHKSDHGDEQGDDDTVDEPEVRPRPRRHGHH